MFLKRVQVSDVCVESCMCQEGKNRVLVLVWLVVISSYWCPTHTMVTWFVSSFPSVSHVGLLRHSFLVRGLDGYVRPPTSVFYPGLELHVLNSICWSSGGQERLLIIPKVTPGSRFPVLCIEILVTLCIHRAWPVLTHSHPKIMSESPVDTKKV